MSGFRRGSVVLVRFVPSVPGEIWPARPAVVVSNEVACRVDAVVQVVPLIDLPDRDLRPYEARVDSQQSGVQRPSRAVANQVRSIGRGYIAGSLGRVTGREQGALDRALRVQLGLSRV